MDDEDAIEGLTRLGLTTYEARVFLALQKLDTGTASEVAEVSEVPRSQVYGTADDLEQRGLIEIQETRPAVYRPVDPDTAEQRLLEQLESTGGGRLATCRTSAGSSPTATTRARHCGRSAGPTASGVGPSS
ncbi:hypothetical protein GJ629_01590 [Halapricum sp. CBA1109]|uniref:TrmB family transcriptional regulator n=1 Tax=Halapricum sp. CBA1109 TaxID=2668068 RepID=UPI0012FBF59F|nr:helix-turn-helix domain-containing protein [Halapricum sp. CBA1109]MUV88736.1 hypothetical protein [Halapricum sp. CBA1109]